MEDEMSWVQISVEQSNLVNIMGLHFAVFEAKTFIRLIPKQCSYFYATDGNAQIFAYPFGVIRTHVSREATDWDF